MRICCFLSVPHHCKLNIFGIWSVGLTKEENWCLQSPDLLLPNSNNYLFPLKPFNGTTFYTGSSLLIHSKIFVIGEIVGNRCMKHKIDSCRVICKKMTFWMWDQVGFWTYWQRNIFCLRVELNFSYDHVTCEKHPTSALLFFESLLTYR